MSKYDHFLENPMTASSAVFLANAYGDGMTVDQFAESLPQSAHVIDVGAGLSDFGKETAVRRADIQWTNFDYNYLPDHPQQAPLDRAKQEAPDNLTFVQGDVLDIPEDMKGQYDRVYSYNLASHLFRFNRLLGKRALEGMVDLLDQNGELMVGPTNAKMATDERWSVTTLPANASTEELDEAERLLTSPKKANIYYNASLVSGVGVYPAKRFDPNARGKIVLSDDGGQTYHKVLSSKGLALTGRLVGGLFHS